MCALSVLFFFFVYIFIYFIRCLVPLLVFSFRLKWTEMIKKNENHHYWTRVLVLLTHSLTHNTETTATLVSQKTHIKTWHPLHYLFITFHFEFFLYFIILKKSSNENICIIHSVSLVMCAHRVQRMYREWQSKFFRLKNDHDNSQMLVPDVQTSSFT